MAETDPLDHAEPRSLPAAGTALAPAHSRHDRRCTLTVVIVLGALYGTLYTGHWFPGASDDAYYLAIARSLVVGDGFRWNGAPVMLVPPGWPMLLAGVMCISPSFALLNALPMLACLGAAVLWYRILRRYAEPGVAMTATLIAATLFHWHRHAFHHYSEGPFLLLTALALLLACQVSEGKTQWWRIGMLCAACVLMVATRWTGLLAVLLVAPAVMSGQRRPAGRRQWIALVLATVAIVGSYGAMRTTLRHMAQRQCSEAIDEADRAKAIDALARDQQRLTKGVGAVGTYPRRFLAAGQWLSRLLWPPAEIGRSKPMLGAATNILGWGLFVLLAVGTWSAVRARQWLWLGAFLQCGALVLIWWRPNPRYLVPIAPLLVLGMWQGAETILTAIRHRTRRRAARAVGVALVAGTVVCNVAILAVNAWTARSSNFTTRCLAGEYADLAAAADYLNQRSVSDDELAVATRCVTLGRQRSNALALRVMHLATNRRVREAPAGFPPEQNDRVLADWAKQEAVRYVLSRPEVVPSRLWHIRTDWLEPDGADGAQRSGNGFFELYELRGDAFVKVDLPDVREDVRRLPGL